MELGLGAGEARDLFGGADGEDFAVGNCDRFNNLRLVVSKTNTGVDDAVEKDDVG